MKGNTVKQESFHGHFEDDKHHGMSDREITLIDETDSTQDLREESLFGSRNSTTFNQMDLMSMM